MKRCAQCGNAVPDNMMFCTRCGAPVPADATVVASRDSAAERTSAECASNEYSATGHFQSERSNVEWSDARRPDAGQPGIRSVCRCRRCRSSGRNLDLEQWHANRCRRAQQRQWCRQQRQEAS
ncbi:hypothetical protein CE161_08195 [Bifidobacterium longum]|uniref:zinc-ribbon domain-containing protein n=1 Tax=Bifidobacterium longum TaxID=216816 RepID=UPI000E21688B|nr:hypothetical protein CE161_08195 [Bifidobacterium longum]